MPTPMSGEEEVYVEDVIDIAKDSAVKSRPVEELIRSPVALSVGDSRTFECGDDDMAVEQLATDPPSNVMMSPFTAYFSRQLPRSPALNECGSQLQLKADFDPEFLEQCADLVFEKDLCQHFRQYI